MPVVEIFAWGISNANLIVDEASVGTLILEMPLHRDASLTCAIVAARGFASHATDLLNKARASGNKKGISHVKSKPLSRFLAELRRFWLPILDELRSINAAETKDPKEFSRLCDEWRDLGVAAGFTEKKERARFDKFGSSVPISSRCAWRGCKRRSQESSGRLLACKGCGEAFYCSRPCQVSYVVLDHRLQFMLTRWTGIGRMEVISGSANA